MITDDLKTNLRKSYDSQSAARDEKENPEWKDGEREHFLKWLKEESKEDILDLGAGPGKDSLFFKENGIQPLAIDISPEMAGLCRQKGVHAEVMGFDEICMSGRSFDAVWAMNSLLHVPKEELDNILKQIDNVLYEGGLFYLGLYGGEDNEGIWEADHYVPKRFFSFHSSVGIQESVSKLFSVENFVVLPKGIADSKFEFQSLILRKKEKKTKNIL